MITNNEVVHLHLIMAPPAFKK